MIRRFLRDRGGNYALMTVITMIPLMGGVALAVDYTELIRQRQATLNALDAAGLAAAQQIVGGPAMQTPPRTPSSSSRRISKTSFHPTRR